MKMGRINWGLLKSKQNKNEISRYKKKYGTQSAIHFTQGKLGLKYGEFGKSTPRIRKAIKRM